MRPEKVTGGLLVCLVLAGCGFDPPPPITDIDARGSDAANIDAEVPDAQTTCVASTITCANDRYIECDAEGNVAREMACPMGCTEGGIVACLDIEASNELTPQVDLAVSAPTIAFTGNSTLNTSTGVVVNAGIGIDVPNETVNGIRVFRFNTLSIDGTLKVSGSAPVALVAYGDVTITGLVDVSADGSTSGPGIRASATTCDGRSVATTTGNSSLAGGGGAGRYQNGANGGTGGTGAGGAGGSPLFDEDLVPLEGGCRGGHADYADNNILYGRASGGGGGGAIQIVSRGQISFSGAGKIDASGGGGQSSDDGINGTAIGGGGGGSGGAILLEAPQILLDGAGVVVSTKGGGGAAAGTGLTAHHGSDGGVAAGAAPGGTNTSNSNGGAGGTESLSPVNGVSNSSGDGGGGGGSVGQTRFNNKVATVIEQNGATIRSRYTVGVLRSRQIVP